MPSRGKASPFRPPPITPHRSSPSVRPDLFPSSPFSPPLIQAALVPSPTTADQIWPCKGGTRRNPKAAAETRTPWGSVRLATGTCRASVILLISASVFPPLALPSGLSLGLSTANREPPRLPRRSRTLLPPRSGRLQPKSGLIRPDPAPIGLTRPNSALFWPPLPLPAASTTRSDPKLRTRPGQPTEGRAVATECLTCRRPVLIVDFLTRNGLISSRSNPDVHESINPAVFVILYSSVLHLLYDTLGFRGVKSK